MAAFRTLMNILLLGACIYYLGSKLHDSWGEWREREIRVSWPWLALALGLNSAGLCVLSGTWTFVMLDHQRTDPSLTCTSRQLVGTYLFSQLGKYVPGKAVVVWIRYASLSAFGLTLIAAAFGTLFETLFNMGIAAGLGSLLLVPTIARFLGEPSDAQGWMPLIGLGFGLTFLFFTLPPVFRWVPKMAGRLFQRTSHPSDHRIAWRVYFQCLASAMVAWSLMGLGYSATLRAVSDGSLSYLAVPTSMGVFLISFVSGFISLVPGHAGVRDAMLTMFTSPMLGGDDARALSASLLSRLVTLASDLLVAGMAGAWMSRHRSRSARTGVAIHD